MTKQDTFPYVERYVDHYTTCVNCETEIYIKYALIHWEEPNGAWAEYADCPKCGKEELHEGDGWHD
jgi:predicted RNA-binding Zn-ribbon protein involved in translation (DUF1610 family)